MYLKPLSISKRCELGRSLGKIPVDTEILYPQKAGRLCIIAASGFEYLKAVELQQSTCRLSDILSLSLCIWMVIRLMRSHSVPSIYFEW